MASPETPFNYDQAAQERSQARERFPEREGLQKSILTGLSKVFAFIDQAKGKGQIEEKEVNLEAEPALRAGGPDLAFFSRYSELALSAALEGDEGTSADEKARLLADYQGFYDFLGNASPEARPRLLSKLAPMNPEAAPWPERQAFARFLTEFYGREKAIGKDEHGQERGFLSLEGQADLVEAWSMKANWGFQQKDFDQIRQEIPSIRERMKKYEDEPLVAPVLVPYLGDKKNEKGEVEQTGVQRTFEELWKLTAAQQQQGYRVDVFQSDPQHLRLRPGFTHTPGLKFEILGLGDNLGQSSDSVRSTEANLPQAGVLAASALHPEWIQAMDGDKVPFAWVSGYEVNVPEPGDEPWRYVLRVHFNRHDRDVFLSAGLHGYRFSYCSVPSPRE